MPVLVVEDDSSICHLAVQALTDAGYSVLAATDGSEALAAIRRNAPDLIVLDLMMPVMDGMAFIEACRQQPHCRDIPIVVMSAAGMRGRYARLNVDALIDKPFELDELVRVVSEVLARSRSNPVEDQALADSHPRETSEQRGRCGRLF